MDRIRYRRVVVAVVVATAASLSALATSAGAKDLAGTFVATTGSPLTTFGAGGSPAETSFVSSVRSGHTETSGIATPMATHSLIPYIRSHQATFDTVNWSGGRLDGNPGFDQVTGQWTVPMVQPSANDEYSYTWLGIDGNLSDYLIQTGTAQASGTDGGYVAWWEIITPGNLAPPMEISEPVSPGDVMQAVIAEVTSGIWGIGIRDVTEGWQYATDQQYSGPSDSAEWIEEDPSSTPTINGLATLADFGSATFSEMSANDPNDITESQAIAMFTPNGQPLSELTAPFSESTTTMTISYVGPLPPAPHDGYQEVASDGGLFSFAEPGFLPGFYGSMGGQHLNAPIVGATPDPNDGGYLEVASDGGIFSFAPPGVTPDFFGSMGGQHLNAPIVGIAFDPYDGGYLEVASDGGIFSFAPAFNTPDFFGSMGGQHLNAPIVGITFDPHDGGYLEVASDGGIFSFAPPGAGADFYGSMGGQHLNAPIVGITFDPNDGGYLEVASDGGIFSFAPPGAGADFFGSMGGQHLNGPIVGMFTSFTS